MTSNETCYVVTTEETRTFDRGVVSAVAISTGCSVGSSCGGSSNAAAVSSHVSFLPTKVGGVYAASHTVWAAVAQEGGPAVLDEMAGGMGTSHGGNDSDVSNSHGTDPMKRRRMKKGTRGSLHSNGVEFSDSRSCFVAVANREDNKCRNAGCGVHDVEGRPSTSNENGRQYFEGGAEDKEEVGVQWVYECSASEKRSCNVVAEDVVSGEICNITPHHSSSGGEGDCEANNAKCSGDNACRETLESAPRLSVLPKHIDVEAASQGIVLFLENLCNENVEEPLLTSDFHSHRIPSMSIANYVLRIQKNGVFSGETLAVSLILLLKYSFATSHPVTYYNVHRLMITSAMLSAKLRDDEFFSNEYYSRVGGISVKEMNKLELGFCTVLQWDIWVEEHEYESLSGLMRQLMEDKAAAATDNSAEVTKELGARYWKEYFRPWKVNFDKNLMRRYERLRTDTEIFYAEALNQQQPWRNQRLCGSGGYCYTDFGITVVPNRCSGQPYHVVNQRSSTMAAGQTDVNDNPIKTCDQQQFGIANRNSGDHGVSLSNTVVRSKPYMASPAVATGGCGQKVAVIEGDLISGQRRTGSNRRWYVDASAEVQYRSTAEGDSNIIWKTGNSDTRIGVSVTTITTTRHDDGSTDHGGTVLTTSTDYETATHNNPHKLDIPHGAEQSTACRGYWGSGEKTAASMGICPK
uniref:WGS project CAEQ00000000 data, annotated contig 316 n=1 Tax=Trypanosoma congolense (strain IL3000) TaxID=1068625 RepID=F9WEU8_TRYCI|nr:unnamed protein product [Trypanosoma congolense IL3000]